MDGRRGRAHRVAWEEQFGPIPDGLILHHLCGVKLCVNVEHLSLMTRLAHNRLHLKREDCGVCGTKKIGRRCRPCAARHQREARARA